MSALSLAGGLTVLVDDDDMAAILATGPWHPRRHGRTVYAQRHVKTSGGRRTTQQMHVFLLGVTGIDHRNGDGLDNRRSNLRLADQSQNTANARIRSDNTSGFKGVTAKRSRWVAQIRVRGHQRHIGTYDTPEAAAAAYDAAARAAFGSFARTNDHQELTR